MLSPRPLPAEELPAVSGRTAAGHRISCKAASKIRRRTMPDDGGLSRRAYRAGSDTVVSLLMAQTLAHPELISLAAGFVDSETLPVEPTRQALDALWADDYVQIRFKNQNTGDWLLLFIPYYEHQEAMHTAHAPAACLVGGGYAPLSRERLQRDFPEPFGRVTIGRMVLEKNRQYLLSNYWFQMRGRIIASEYANKWYLFWDSVTRRRTDGALVDDVEDPTAGRDHRAHAVEVLVAPRIRGAASPT